MSDFLRQALDNGGFADAGFAEQHGIVLGATTKYLNDPLDFVLATNDRVHLALAGDFREVAAERLQRGSFHFALFLRRFLHAFAGGLFFLRGKVWIQFLQYLLAGLLDIDV